MKTITIKKTFKELLEIDAIIGNLYKKDEELKNGKFGYAYKRFNEKNIQPAAKEYQQAFADLYVEHALEDEKTKALIVDKDSHRGYAYSKSGMTELLKAERKLEDKFNSKEFEVEAYISPSIPKNLSEFEYNTLKGVII